MELLPPSSLFSEDLPPSAASAIRMVWKAPGGVSFSHIRSYMAASQFRMKTSEASFPQGDLKAFLSIVGTNTLKK